MGRRKKCNNPLNAICHRCGNEKPLTDFYFNKSRWNGRSSRCKQCSKEMPRIIKHEPRNRCLKCGKPTHRKKFCSQRCAHIRNVIENSLGDKFINCRKCKNLLPLTSEFFYYSSANKNIQFSTLCKSCSNKQSEEWRKTEQGRRLRLTNRKKNIKTTIRYRENHKKDRNNNENIRRKTDPSFALKNRMRILMYSSLRRIKNGRKWQDLVGYSIDDLRRHIEKQFKDGMSWTRFFAGEIHIDHKIPVSVFNFNRPEDIDFKRCWALKNLQPMWAKENIQKHAKIQKPFQPALILH